MIRKQLSLVVFGLAGLIAVVYFRVLFMGETFVLRDALRFTLPSREAFAAAASAGRIPGWWDGVGFGVAFAANPVHGVTSPVSWPFLLSGSPWAFDLLTLTQLLILALGVAALAARLGASPISAFFSGVTVTMSGYVVSAVPNGAVPYLSWVPWVAWAALGCTSYPEPPTGRLRPSVFFTVAVALQLLSGEPGHLLVTGLLVVVLAFSLGRPVVTLRRLALPAAAALPLAAVGVLPAFLLLRESARSSGAADRILKWSMHPGRLIEIVWPLPFGSEGSESWFPNAALGLPPGDPFFSLSLFTGVPVLLLALAGGSDPRVRRLLFASSGFLLLALGSHTPLYGLLSAVLPPLRVVNFPEKFFFGALLIWCISAGVGLSRVMSARPPKRWLGLSSFVVSVPLALAAAVISYERDVLAARLGPAAAGVNLVEGLELSAAGAAVAAFGCILFAAALWLARRDLSPPVFVCLVFTAALVPLLFAVRAVTTLASRTLVRAAPRVLVALPRSPLFQKDVRPRLFHFPAPHIRPPLSTGAEIASDIAESLDVNVASRFGYGVIPGFEPGDSSRFRRLWEEISPQMSFPAFVRLLGVDFALVPDPDRFAPGFPVLARLPGWGIVGTFPVRPRAFVAPRATPVVSADTGLASLAWPGRENDPARVVLSGEGAESLDARGPLEPCRVTSPRPESLTLDCQSPSGGYAVILDENLPGWSAELDGRSVPILTADGLFRAVRVGAGLHRVTFSYRTPGLRPGAALSLLTLAVLVFLLARSHRKTDSR